MSHEPPTMADLHEDSGPIALSRLSTRLAYGPRPNAGQRADLRKAGEAMLNGADNNAYLHLVGGLLVRVADLGDALESAMMLDPAGDR